MPGITDRVAAWALVSPDLQPVVPRRVADGRAEADGRRVSHREAEVLSLIGENLTNAEIAERLYISERTVESHVSSLLRKLDAGDRRELGRLAATFSRAPDAAPARPPLPATLELLADAATFVGREGERAELRRLWQRTRDGHTFTLTHQGLFKDQRIELVEGTVYRFTAVETGRPVSGIAPDGTKVNLDRGRIRYTFLIDTLGDADLSNDVFLGAEEPDVAGPHPVFIGEADFCDLLDTLR